MINLLKLNIEMLMIGLEIIFKNVINPVIGLICYIKHLHMI